MAKKKGNGYECFHCGEYAVAWDSDFNFEDMCLEGDGIVHMCHCNNCGAQIEYRIPLGGEENEDNHDNDNN